jgi:hypothetical protein
MPVNDFTYSGVAKNQIIAENNKPEVFSSWFKKIRSYRKSIKRSITITNPSQLSYSPDPTKLFSFENNFHCRRVRAQQL